MVEAGAAMMPGFEIRQLHLPDVGEYRRIRLSTLATEPDYFGSTVAEESSLPLAKFAERLATAAVFGACAAGGLVGVAHFSRATRATEAHKGFVQGFFVEPEWRGRGVGAGLMTALLATATTVVEQITLTVVEGNVAAISLYQRFGFTTYGVEPRARITTRGYANEVLMVRLLG